MSNLLSVEFGEWMRLNWDAVRSQCKHCNGTGIGFCKECGGYGIIPGLYGSNNSISDMRCNKQAFGDPHIWLCDYCIARALQMYERDMTRQTEYVSGTLCFTPAT